MNKIENELTQEQAVALFNSNFWESMTDQQIAEFQLNTERLCMPFGVFHRAVEVALGRSVWTHEFASDHLRKELAGEKSAPTLAEIIALIPEEKRVIILDMGTSK